MARTLEAVYENGVLRPLEPLALEEHQHVQVTVSPMAPADEEALDLEYLRSLERTLIPEVSLEEVRRRLAKIPGTMTADFIAEREGR
jgi:predicted DNA-binding antitoxin AbrB/MazE fold protein